jgi:CDP-diacylglycerol---serine O-phosphatidyltransferase
VFGRVTRITELITLFGGIKSHIAGIKASGIAANPMCKPVGPIRVRDYVDNDSGALRRNENAQAPVRLGNRHASRYIVDMRYSLRSPFEPGPPGRPRRFRAVPVRTMVPNVITLLALCAGLTAIRLAAEGTFEWAVYAIVFAAVLDGIDGRVARLLKGTSRFGAELDSLADFVNFGVAPGVTLYFWSLHDAKSAGWIGAMVFAIAAGLRLARFNVTIDDPDRPSWAVNFFVGMPAPAGAITVLLPVYIHFLGIPAPAFMVPVTLIYTLAIALLMVSRLPVYSGKKVGKRVPPDLVLPVFIGVVVFFALLIAYPWAVLTIGALAYLASLPFGWLSHRGYVRREAQANAEGQRSGRQGEPLPAASDVSMPSNGDAAVLPFERGGERPTSR